MSIDHKKLIKAAKELNEVMGLKPAIDTKASDEKVTAGVLKAMEEISDDDEFSPATQEVLTALIEEDEPEEEEEEDEPEDEEEDEPEEEEEEEEEEADDDEDEDEDEKPAKPVKPPKPAKPPYIPKNLPEKVAVTGKLVDLKEMVTSMDEFKKLRKTLDTFSGMLGPRDLKVAMFKALGVDPPAIPGMRIPGAKRDGTMKITVLVKENPKREGTNGYKHFALYKKGMTVGEFLEAGGTTGDLDWDVRHNFIKLG